MAVNKYSSIKSKELSFPLARIKTIMKSSPDVENISQDSLHITARAAELFIQYLAQEALRKGGGHQLEYKHIAEIVQTDECTEFLREIMPEKITYRQYKDLMKEKGIKINDYESTSEDDEEDSVDDSDNEDSNDSENDAT